MRTNLRGIARATRWLALTIVVAAFSATARGAAYELTDLGSVLGPGGVPSSINDAGAIVGRYVSPQGVRPFKYENGTFTDLGVPPGTQTGGQSGVFAQSTSANGLVAGFSFAPDARPRAIVFQNGSATELAEPAGATGSQAVGINSSGTAVGFWQNAAVMQFPVVWNNGVPTTINPPDSSGGFAHAINDAGTIVGRFSQISSGHQKPFVYQNGTYTVLPTLTAEGGAAHALNDVGGVAGASSGSNGELHAFYYANGQLVDIGTLGGRFSDARGVNNSGVVVGSFEPAGAQRLHGFVYRDGQAFDLNDLIDPSERFVIETALAINNAGQIVGTGFRVGDTTPYSFLLTPVPEPAAALAAASLALLALRQRR